MARTIGAELPVVLKAFAVSTKYPTRTVETAFSWVMLVWGASVVLDPGMIASPQYSPMLVIMPTLAWGWCAVVISTARLAALFANGHWRPSPEFRLAGAAWAMMLWAALGICYYIAVAQGAPDFPMRRVFAVFVFFEAYSCYRCGQDIGKRQKADQKIRDSEPSRLMGADYG